MARLSPDDLQPHETRALLDALFEGVPLGVALVDRDGRCLRTNPHMAALLGVTPDVDRMQPAYTRLGPLWQDIGAVVRTALAEGESRRDFAVSLELPPGSGQVRHCRVDCCPIRTVGSDISAVGIILLEVTARREAESRHQAGRLAEQRFVERMERLYEACLELSSLVSFNDLCRRAVELGRTTLGFDRLSLWFGVDGDTAIQGSFGIDEEGNLRDELHLRIALEPDWPLTGMLQKRQRLVHLQDVSLHGTEGIVGHGEQVYAGLWNGTDTVGILCADNLLSGSAYTTQDCELIGMYGTIIGHLATRQRAEEALRATHAQERQFHERLALLHEIGMRLSAAPDLDDLCRQAVNLGRAYLGFDRLGLWFSSDSPEWMRGSFGTDEHGQTRDERDVSFHINTGSPPAEILLGKVRSVCLRDAPLYGLCDVVGQGDTLLAALWDGAHVIGYMTADNLFSGEPFPESQSEILTQYVASIGQLYTRLRTELALRETQATLEQRVEERTAALRQREAQFFQVEKLRSLGEISAGIAHDLNNRLTAVLGHTQLASRDTDPVSIRRRLAVIEQAAGDAAETVRRIRDFARQQAETDGHPVDLASVAADALALAQPHWRDLAQERGIRIVVVSDLGAAPAYGQNSELRDAVFNLLQNAVTAMPEGGTLTLRTGIDAERPRLIVQDTGVGMSDEVRRRCFDPFFTTRGVEGTGLGLATVYATVMRHSGDLILETRPGAGTAIGFSLPAAPPVQPTDAASRHAPGRGQRLLVVEDEPLVREMLNEMLAGAGYQVSMAADADMALSLLDQRAFDLVLTDQGMPGMPGSVLASVLEQRHAGVAVLVLTGWGAETVGRIRSGNVRAVLAKPVREEALLAAVAQALGR